MPFCLAVPLISRLKLISLMSANFSFGIKVPSGAEPSNVFESSHGCPSRENLLWRSRAVKSIPTVRAS